MGVAGEALVVRHRTNDPAPGMRRAQEVRYGLAALGVEVSGRLVGEKDGMYSNHHRVFASGVLACGRGLASHSFTVLSSLADASRCPSGLNATLQTPLVCPFRVSVS